MIGFVFAAGLLAVLGFAIFDDDDDSEPRDADLELEGTNGADTLQGGAGNDLLLGLDGNDRIDADAGADTVEGGPGDDRLFGGPGNDRIDGGEGWDRIDGGQGNDLLVPGAPTPPDAPFGTDENGDLIVPNPPFDYVTGGPGNDTIAGIEGEFFAANGDAGDDRITGSTDGDLLVGGAGADFINGAQGDDYLYGGELALPLDQGGGSEFVEDKAPDTLQGGRGDDLLLLQGGDTGTGGLGLDVFAMAESGEDVAPGAQITVTDFTLGEDFLLLFFPPGAEAENSLETHIDAQRLTEAGVEIDLGSGATLVLQGVAQRLGLGDIAVVEQDEVAF